MHSCYYLDMPEECLVDEKGIPKCKLAHMTQEERDITLYANRMIGNNSEK